MHFKKYIYPFYFYQNMATHKEDLNIYNNNYIHPLVHYKREAISKQ